MTHGVHGCTCRILISSGFGPFIQSKGGVSLLLAKVARWKRRFWYTLAAGLIFTASNGAMFAASTQPSFAATVPASVALKTVKPAPKGFRAILQQIAAAQLRIAKNVSMLQNNGTLQLAETSAHNISKLSARELGVWYQGYGSLAAAQAVVTDLNKVADSLGAKGTRRAASYVPSAPGNPGGGMFNPSQTPPDTCIQAPSDYAIEAALIAATVLHKVASALPKEFTIGVIVAGEGTVTTIPDPAYYVALASYYISEGAYQAMTFIYTLSNDCETAAHIALLGDLYNNLSDSQQLINSELMTALTNVSALTELTNSRTQAILNQTADLRQYVQEQTTAILDNSDALTTLMNNNQTTFLADFTTVEKALNVQLSILIQQNLLDSAQANLALFELPASVGGYLNRTPVGVQSVVTQAFEKMTEAHITLPRGATTALSEADELLNAGKYPSAYEYFKLAYQTLVSVPQPVPHLPG